MSVFDRIRERERELQHSHQHAHNLKVEADRLESRPTSAPRRSKIAQLLDERRRSIAHAGEISAELDHLRAEAAHVDHSRPLPRWGVDYAWDHPLPVQLRAAGVTFACRYVNGSGGKELTTIEAENLGGAGIDVVAIFEAGAERARDGYQAGAQDARTAAGLLDRVSKRAAGRPIYLACDFDAAGAGATGTVLEYVRGAVHAIGWHRVGLYAGIGPIEAAHAANRCQYLWQTLAWSGGRWSPHAQLRQVQVDRRIGGHDVDVDEAVAADFGQWRG